MKKEEIYKKIDEIYNSEKGKGFITHLLRSFLPINKSYKLLLKEDKHKMVDCITGEKLCDVNTALNLTNKYKIGEHMVNKLISDAKGEQNDEYYDNLRKMKDEMGNIAITCDGSNKLMSQETLEQLFNFYASQILIGNKHINWVANNERAKELISFGEKNGFVENKKEKNVIKKAVEHSKMTLGDLDVLKELKKKFEENEIDK